MQAPQERLGSFYLGAEYDLQGKALLETSVNYDARDLTTHAVCVGMTGSGKTGLCIGLLEEAALDKVPTLIIDPKGDMTNLLLQFPELRADDFQPWINADDARRKGKTVEEFAESTAELWRNGLADWGIGPERIRALQQSADFTVYTPGSDAGVPISILGSLAAPALDFDSHAEAIRERISGTVAALLGLVGLNADPIRSREAILLANIFEHFWSKSEDLDLAKLILAIQNPPVRKLGVFEVDTFYPEKERFELAMAFNGLVASPNFQSWLQGEALNIDTLLYTADGQPRHSIFYISHLSDQERMFFVTLLLENVVTWMRGQPGTTSLRALLYFDEIFGFMPPTAEPPSKRPLLTLLKQARAFGLGLLLVTQNPVDIDYKGLTNAGTWFIGKLQAERDKDRVVQGLKGAIAEAGGQGNEVDYDTLLTQLGSRVFLMNNVHAGAPVVFHTRWAMSYLRGPLTRPQVRQLMAGRSQAAPAASPAPAARTAQPLTVAATSPEPPPAPAAQPVAPLGYAEHAPVLAPSVTPVFVPVAVGEQAATRQLSEELGQTLTVEKVELLYDSALIGAGEVRFVDRKRKLNEQLENILVLPAADEARKLDWGQAETLPLHLSDLSNSPERVAAGQGPFFGPLSEAANNAQKLKSIGTDLADWLYYNSRLTLTTHEALGLFQEPGESLRDFKIRLQQAAREQRDTEVDALEKKFETQIKRITDKLKAEERGLAEAEADYEARKQQEIVGIGESVIGFFFGRRSTRALSSAASKRRMTSKAKGKIEESQEEVEELRQEISKLEAELKAESDEITRKWDGLLENLTSEEVAPRRTDVNVKLTSLAWLPSWLITYTDGRGSHTATVVAYAQPAEV